MSYIAEEPDAFPSGDIDIEDLDFSERTYILLRRANINTLNDLLSRSRYDVLKIRNIGPKSLEEIERKLAELDVQLKDEEQS